MSQKEALGYLYHIAYHPHENEKQIREEAKHALRELGENLEAEEREAAKEAD